MERQLLIGLLDYIDEQAKVIDPRVFRLKNSTGFLRQQSDLADLPGVEFDISIEGDHFWLRVQRIHATNPPEPESQSRHLIRVGDDPNGAKPSIDEVAYKAHMLAEANGKSEHEFQDFEKQGRELLEQALTQYAQHWDAWAEGEKTRRKTIELYGDLFAIKHQIEAEETAKPRELIWGVGIASWQMEYQGATFDFEYPLLSQQMEVGLDDATMALYLRPRATDTRYEGDAFAACLGKSATGVEQSAKRHLEQNRERSVTPFDPGSYTDVLTLVASNLDGQGVYKTLEDLNGQVPAPGEHLVVTDAWTLFTRPRSNNYLLEDLAHLKQSLLDGCNIPDGPAAFVTLPSDEPVPFSDIQFRGLSSRSSGSSGDKVRELYFPLPYNQEQITIVKQLEQSAGVAVQGPPGTGKTHTIANIICHYLATGRRVLVTSKGEPALKVLQEKIPEQIRPLTVALLTGDRESLRQFEGAIDSIQAEVSQINQETTLHEIQQCESRIDHAHVELVEIDRRIDDIAQSQLTELLVDGQHMRAQKLAELVINGQSEYGWFDDEVMLIPEHEPPLSDENAARLRATRRKLGADLVYIQARVPAIDDLLPLTDISLLHNVLMRMQEIEKQVDQGTLTALRANTPEVIDAARQLLAVIDIAVAIMTEINELGEAWAYQLRQRCRQHAFRAELSALESLFGEMDVLRGEYVAFLQRPVEVPLEALGSSKVYEAVQRGASIGKPFGLVSIGSGDAKKIVTQVKVGGLPPLQAEDWEHVKRYLDLHLRIITFVTRWNQIAPALGTPALEGCLSELRRIITVFETTGKAHLLGTRYDAELLRKADEVFGHIPATWLIGSLEDLMTVRIHVTTHLKQADLAQAARRLSVLKANLSGTTGPISNELMHFVDTKLGCEDHSAERIMAEYERLVTELRRIHELTPDLGVVDEAARRIEHAGAPKLASRIRSGIVLQNGDDGIFPSSWRKAWNWARAKRHLEQIEAREELLTLATKRRDLEQGLSKLYEEMVSLSAWLETKKNASPRVLQALQGYATAIQQICQGTGPNAIRYRRDARHHMTSAADAIPCWIMSHAKVSESIPADIGAFDLVIVDEASQSNLWALPAVLRGKKILVVGDNKQVSPDGNYISSQRIQQLRDRFLVNQPFQQDMTPEKSLYDLAARVFAAQHVKLREHFRCVPPIIAYSNRQFYENAIQPLRIPKMTERIDPPLVDVYITEGVRDRRDCNHEEADYIAEEIAALIEDERFAKRTIGVVSLLGMEQAKLIDKLVRKRCNAAELLRRHFDCGDARTFQGSERDIMFLSLVADPAKSKALSGNKFEQRFNVAASRARDRMYLVRSVETSHLSEKDLRLSLLQHFDKPIITDRAEAETLLERCESGFERQVYTALTEKGFRTIPQVKVGSYWIDLVVEGDNDVRLAIECDGDEFHGPDRWPQDMARQRILERAGWTFWRCFASTWQLHKEEVLAELIERLAKMGIEPLGAIQHISLLVEKRLISSAKPRLKEEFDDDVTEEL